MIYHVRHRTTVTYESIVRLARFNLRLRPASWPDQATENFALSVLPEPASFESRSGAYVVNLSRLVIDHPLNALTVESSFTLRSMAEAKQPQDDDPSIAEVAKAAMMTASLLATSPANYVFPSARAPLDRTIGDWAVAVLAPERGIVAAALALALKIQAECLYDADATDADTPVEVAFAARRGVCQDFAHIMIVALRHAGLPAAYASGYLRTIPPPGQPRLVGVDAMHAWVMLWCGDKLGWIGFDPTNGCITGSDHLFVAMGRDYADVTPIDGVFVGSTAQRITASVDVAPVET